MNLRKRSIWLTVLVIVAASFVAWRSYGEKSDFGSATLSWGANTETDLAGYRIYYGTEPRTGDCPPGGYAEKVDAGKRTSYEIDNLKPGESYYFSVTSYNAAGKESCFSEEISKKISLFDWKRIKSAILGK